MHVSLSFMSVLLLDWDLSYQEEGIKRAEPLSALSLRATNLQHICSTVIQAPCVARHCAHVGVDPSPGLTVQ